MGLPHPPSDGHALGPNFLDPPLVLHCPGRVKDSRGRAGAKAYWPPPLNSPLMIGPPAVRFALRISLEAFSLPATFTLPATCLKFCPCIAHFVVSILVLYEGDMGINIVKRFGHEHHRGWFFVASGG